MMKAVCESAGGSVLIDKVSVCLVDAEARQSYDVGVIDPLQKVDLILITLPFRDFDGRLIPLKRSFEHRRVFVNSVGLAEELGGPL